MTTPPASSSSSSALISPRLGDFAARAFRERWVDAEPRPGKRDGAFCMAVRGDESRVFANFKPAFGGMSTLAHELGHGYHNLNLAERTMLQSATPMTLAETASIFCETIVRHAALQDAAPARADRDPGSLAAGLLPGGSGHHQPLPLRAAVFERAPPARAIRGRVLRADARGAARNLRRRPGPGSAAPLHVGGEAALLQRGPSFYNFPYMFGLLFGLGLYARYQQDPSASSASYDELLSVHGSGGRRDAGGAVWHRHPHGRVLAFQPRRDSRRHRTVRAIDWRDTLNDRGET